MRTGLVIAACVLAVVVVGGAVNLRITSQISQTYVNAAAELREMCMQKDWQAAQRTALAYCQSWERTEKWLQMLVDHADTDAVMLALLTIRAGAEAQDLPTCLAGCGQLAEAAGHICHRDAFTLGNIL